ncbi:MAG: excisionase [Thermoflexaceae bacterium]|nr:excisionase [Thermoflexaceae bacterium]
MSRDNNVPLWHKYTLTISEASVYFNIGEKKLRQLVQENATADFLLNNGVKVLIKRVKFEQFIDETCSI